MIHIHITRTGLYLNCILTLTVIGLLKHQSLYRIGKKLDVYESVLQISPTL